MYLDNITPIKFHPYTSRTTKRVFRTEYKSGDEFYKFKKQLLNYFNSCGIKCRDDNKIVFECDIGGRTVCYGFYDWIFSIGLDYYDENEK